VYFPKGFDIVAAVELGGLVVQAYDQFDAFENGRPWKLSGEYELLRELRYAAKGPGGILDLDLRSLFGGVKGGEASIPIGFVARRGRRSFVVFRGTKTAKEWTKNFNVNLVPYPLPGYGNAHEGFLRTYLGVQAEIAAALSERGGRGRLYLAGHSLGAALATLALPDIESSLKARVTALYTFGSPRAGDGEFARAFDASFGDRSFRIANCSDVVASIPPPAPLAGFVGGYFAHVDTPVDFDAQANDVEANHAMKTYLAALGAERARRGFLARLISRIA
jgi:pimeloyl-ACP methyl ester carboxylesterase